MRKLLIIAGVLVSVMLISVFMVVPIFAQDASSGIGKTPIDSTTSVCPNLQQICPHSAGQYNSHGMMGGGMMPGGLMHGDMGQHHGGMMDNDPAPSYQ